MNLEANNNGGPSGGNRKYPNKHGYEADMGTHLYNPEVFSDMSIDIQLTFCVVITNSTLLLSWAILRRLVMQP